MPSDWLEMDDFVRRFEQVWEKGGQPAIDDFLPREGPLRLAVLKELVLVDLQWRQRVGEPKRTEDYLQRYPELGTVFTDATVAHDTSQPNPLPVELTAPPQQIGRYRVEKILGKGGFGCVFLAHDDQLQRLVGIKVPHAHLVAKCTDAEAYLTEARTVANLDHPNIVPVHDVGSTAQFPCYVVSKYIDGTDLATRLKQSRLTLHEAVEVVATVSEAIHHAHMQGLVHRDIKPGNILLDKSGKPFVGDFGLALREHDVGKGPRYAGTPAYMSPEQARGEGHRVDGRSDIFSLGVVFYELLTGRRPFQAESRDELLDQIADFEARPPRQIDDHIPKELDRICLKALSKRASERYSAAKDMADDLRHFLAEQNIQQQSCPDAKGGGSDSPPAEMQLPSISIASSRSGATSASTPNLDSQPVKIVPKGLRSFDAHDADFFLELLPGPRDREGLPDSIRFWKTQIEEMDPDNTFSVGLIYGPSGCGKSSLVKAGLLPRLSGNVIAVYVEATAKETETRLLNGLRKRFPALPANRGLKETLAALRRGQGIPVGKKVLIVLDQFEQWLHAKKAEDNTELVQALRQCDGGRVQCIVMVRDDFWMAATQFMRALEIRLLEGQNSAAVDLFPPHHAEKVLAAFGRAFGVLPDSSSEISKDQKHFLEEAVSGLASEGKVICVRLALFADMMKGKSWTPGSLKAVGGTEGVGFTFLEETFSTATAPPEHRYHQKAARAILKALFPEAGTNIKGHMRSHAELLAASGYGNRPKDFDDLIRLLDNELRLITPTDPEGVDEGGGRREEGGRMKTEGEPSDSSLIPHPSSFRFYQLTHDYLVHSVREWLSRKQKETRRGRAELLLADRAAIWSSRPESRQLPSMLQWFQIRWLTTKKNWTLPQQKMMRKAGRFYAVRGVVVAALLVTATFSGFAFLDHFNEEKKATHAAGLVSRLLDADTAGVPEIIDQMEDYRLWVDPLLEEEFDKQPQDSPKKLYAGLALLRKDKSYLDFVLGRLLEAAPQQIWFLHKELQPYQGQLQDRLWKMVAGPEKSHDQHYLSAACCLACLPSGKDANWPKISQTVVDSVLVSIQKNSSNYVVLLKIFQPVGEHLLNPLSSVFRKKDRSDSDRTFATRLFAEYAKDRPDVLADLLMDADEKQFTAIYPKFKEQSERGLPLLTAEIDKSSVIDKDMIVFKTEGKIADDDPKIKPTAEDAMPAKRFEVRLEAGRQYRFTMDSNELDSFLVLQDKRGKELAFDDDSGGGLNSLIVYRPKVDDTFTVYAASIKGTGSFQLRIAETLSEDGKEKLAKRQANAAVALLMMNQTDKVWPLLKHSPDPRVRSYLIHRFGPLGAKAEALIKRLDDEPEVTIRRALILSLGSFGESQLPLSQRQQLINNLLALYEFAPDAGLHGAADWLLRQWGQETKLKALDNRLRTNERQLHEAVTASQTEEQKARSSKLAKEIGEIQKKLAQRQEAWERSLRDQVTPSVASLQEGLIAYYPLDETVGANTANAVKGQPGGTYRGTSEPKWVPGVIGGSLRLDGKGEIVGGGPLELESNNSFSYGCWFRCEGKPALILLSTRDGAKGYRGFDISLEPGYKLRIQIVGEDPKLPENKRQTWSPFYLSIATATNVAPEKDWHHVMVTYDGSTKAKGVRIYVDGKQQPLAVGNDDLRGTIKTDAPLRLGSRGHGTYLWKGQIDEVRVYNRLLQENEVQQLYKSRTTAVQTLVTIAAENRTWWQQKLVTYYYSTEDKLSQQLYSQLRKARASMEKIDWAIGRRWYINSQGQTMVVIPGPVVVLMGSPTTEAGRPSYESQHEKRIARTFALAAKSVTVEQYRQFDKDYALPDVYTRMPQLPVVGISWQMAASFCNWLSQQEGVPEEEWCYETATKGKTGPTVKVLKLREKYLSLSGYRLPTEAEMEYSTRAETVTARFYGETEELLPQYAWYLENSKEKTQPVGSLKPNDFGLFDIQGNVITWCQESYKWYPLGREISDDSEDDLMILGNFARVLRGSSFGDRALLVRSANRSWNVPAARLFYNGFRVSRSLPVHSFTALPPTPEGGRQ